jgi:hypothetical protein
LRSASNIGETHLHFAPETPFAVFFEGIRELSLDTIPVRRDDRKYALITQPPRFTFARCITSALATVEQSANDGKANGQHYNPTEMKPPEHAFDTSQYLGIT